MDTRRTDDILDRFEHLRRTLYQTTGQAQRAIESTRAIQKSETMQHIMAQQRLDRTRSALSESSALIR